MNVTNINQKTTSDTRSFQIRTSLLWDMDSFRHFNKSSCGSTGFMKERTDTIKGKIHVHNRSHRTAILPATTRSVTVVTILEKGLACS